MRSNGSVVTVVLPENMNHAGAQKFLMEMLPLMNNDRPRIVLDCSLVEHMDSAGIEALLECMANVMKRDGDIKLAAVSPAASTILELMRADRLFEVFGTTEEAARSFQAGVALDEPQTLPWYAPDFSLTDLKAAS
jgi:anti-sigma B factor antagonist